MSKTMCTKDKKERTADRKKHAQKMRERIEVRKKGGEVLRERFNESRERRKRDRKERPLVSSFPLVIGFSDWSKLFFSILLASTFLTPLPSSSER